MALSCRFPRALVASELIHRLARGFCFSAFSVPTWRRMELPLCFVTGRLRPSRSRGGIIGYWATNLTVTSDLIWMSSGSNDKDLVCSAPSQLLPNIVGLVVSY